MRHRAATYMRSADRNRYQAGASSTLFSTKRFRTKLSAAITELPKAPNHDTFETSRVVARLRKC
jgi:hypothetical protein